MKFKTVAEAFNFYRNYTVEAMETRAQEIKGIIETDPDVDINSLNIELTGIKEAKDNATAKAGAGAGEPVTRSMNVITGMNTASTNPNFDIETVADTKEYRSAFFKNMLGQELNATERKAWGVATKVAEQRADAFTASGDAVAVIPTTTLNEIIKKARTMGGLMNEARAFNVPTKIAIPVGTPGTKADWHVEGAEVKSEKVTPASVIFDGYEIIKLFSISAKVRKMSINAFESYLVDELTNCVMETIADSLVNGTGAGQGTGLEKGITWTNNVNSLELADADLKDWTNYTKLVGMLKRGYSNGAKFACNNAFLWGTIFSLKDDNNRPIYMQDVTGQTNGKLFGFDVIVDDNIANNTLYFGNFAKYLGYNLPDGIVVETSTQSSFRKGLIDYRALAIADCKPIVADAFVKMTLAGE